MQQTLGLAPRPSPQPVEALTSAGTLTLQPQPPTDQLDSQQAAAVGQVVFVVALHRAGDADDAGAALGRSRRSGTSIVVPRPGRRRRGAQDSPWIEHSASGGPAARPNLSTLL